MLTLEGSEIVVPDTVAVEIRRRGSDDPAAHALEKTAWLKVIRAPQIPDIIRAWDLGEGVRPRGLAWGYANAGTAVIVDDLAAARRCAATLGIPVRGDTRSHLDCKEKRVIPQARPVLENLRRSGMYLS